MTTTEGKIREPNELSYRFYGERSRKTSAETYKDFAGSQGEATAREASCWWLRDEPQVSVRGLLEQGPAATGKAALSGQESQRKQYLKRPRRESSTTAFKAAATTGGLSYPHEWKRSNGQRY